MKVLVGKKLIAVVALAMLLLIVISAVSRGSGARLLATAGWVTHTHETVAKLETMSHWIERAETAQRDFLIIGQDSYLEPYDLAIRAIDQTGGELRALTLDDPVQQHRLYRLLALVQARRDEINESIELRRQHGVRVSLPEVLTGAGAATANAIHDVIGEMEAEEQSLLKQRVAEASASARWADLLIAVGDALALGLVGLSGGAIYRDIVRRARAETALRESEARYRSLIGALSEGIVYQDQDGVIRTCNASAERILGLSVAQMMGRSSLDPRWRTIHEDGTPFPGDQHPAMVTLHTGQACENVIMGVHKPDGTLSWLSVNAHPMFQDGASQPCAVVCTFSDISENLQAKAALAKERDLLWALMDSFPNQIYFKDTQGYYSRVNLVQARILGVDHPDRVVGTTDFDYYQPSIAIEARADEDWIIATGEALVAKVERQVLAYPNQYDPTGEQSDRFFSTTKAPILDRQGQIVGIVGITHDITEQKRIEEALRATEQRFRTLVEQLPAITYIAALDENSSTIYTSPQIETMLGFTQADWMADHDLWRKQIHPDDYDRVMADMLQSQTSGVPVPSEYRMLMRNGRARWFRDQAVVVHDSDGQPLFMQGIMFDITERKLSEAALRASESRNRALLDAIPDLMFRLSRDGVYLDVRADNASNLTLPPDVLLGKTVFDVLPLDVASQVLAGIEQALRTEAVQLIEYQLVLEQTVRDFEARVVICAENEILAIVRDITERKQIERMKNEFVSTVSHELRTPLTSIRGSLGLIAGGVAGPLPTKARGMVEIAYKNSERLIRLINDILDIEKIESGKMIFNLQPVDLLQLLEHVIDLNRSYGQQFGVTFALESATVSAWVYADSDRLIQAVTNLLSNAAKFSPPGAQVLVSLARRGEALRIAIHDRGPGIPEAFRERLFQKFAQADASDARQKGGTGLGLSITKAIIERMAGQVDVRTEPGGGSTFFIDLPEWRPVELACAGPPTPRVLIYQPDREAAALLAALLRQSGFAADIAYAAEEAMGRLAAGAYAALVLDLMPAGEAGMTLIGDLREQESTRSLPIVVFSARPASSDLQLPGPALATDYCLEQTNDPGRLIDVLKRLDPPAVARRRILHVEDDADIQQVVAAIVGDLADVVPATTLDEACRKLREQRFDLIILDLELPDGNGLALLHNLGEAAAMPAPVVIFSVREISWATVPNVAATLVKSQASNRELLETVMALIWPLDSADHGGER